MASRSRKKSTKPSVTERLLALSESNLFWGGGIAFIVTGLGSLLGGFVTFSAVLISIGWIILGLSIFRFFHISKKITLLISIFIGFLLLLVWLLLRPTVVVEPVHEAQENVLVESTNAANKMPETNSQIETQSPVLNGNKPKDEITSNEHNRVQRQRNTDHKSGQSLTRARQLVEIGRYADATAECNRILRINPNNASAKSFKAWIQKQQKILNNEK